MQFTTARSARTLQGDHTVLLQLPHLPGGAGQLHSSVRVQGCTTPSCALIFYLWKNCSWWVSKLNRCSGMIAGVVLPRQIGVVGVHNLRKEVQILPCAFSTRSEYVEPSLKLLWVGPSGLTTTLNGSALGATYSLTVLTLKNFSRLPHAMWLSISSTSCSSCIIFSTRFAT